MSGKEQIVTTITDYCQSILTSLNSETSDVVLKAIQPSISHATNEKLTYIPSAAEIKEALFSIHPDKAPGPDGFSASFFQSNWSTVNPAIIKEIQDFFRNRGAT